MKKEILEKLKTYFESRDEVVMAFLFGSAYKGTMTDESDVDIAIYFKSEGGRVDLEEKKSFPNLDEIWRDVEKITQRNTDVVVLNNASANVASAAISNGRPIIIKDRALYWRFYLPITSWAEDFRIFVESFWKIKERSRSLSKEDRERLIRTIDFMKDELADLGKFKNLDRQTYEKNQDQRRNVERWTENIINASIDIAKIILASSKQKIPGTYKEVLANLALLSKFNEPMAEKLAGFATLRNFLAHEYFDLRFKEIRNFVENADEVYRYLFDYAVTYCNL